MRMLIAMMLTLMLAHPAWAGGTLAILYFDNQGNPELESLKVGLSQMLITDLQGTPDVTVVERAKLQAILDELELGHSGVADPTTAAKIGKLLGAQYMIFGSYMEVIGTLRVDARLVEVETSKILDAHGVDGETKTFLALEKKLAEHFRTALPVHLGATKGAPAEAPPAKTGKTRSEPAAPTEPSAPSEPAVVRQDQAALDSAIAYSEGLIFLDGKDAAKAKESFEVALKHNPDLGAAKDALAALEL